MVNAPKSSIVKRPRQSAIISIRKSESVYIKLKELMLEEDDQNKFYSERFLADTLDIGLASVRAAISRLLSEGIVELVPEFGVRVRQISYREMMDFYELRMLIEPHIVQRLVGQLEHTQSEKLMEIIALQKRAAVSRDAVSYYRLDLEFHNFLANAYGNRNLVRALNQMHEKMYRLSKHLYSTHSERLFDRFLQHERVALAILNGSSEEARAAMVLHLEWGMILLSFLKDRR